jgi:hypothetical protein
MPNPAVAKHKVYDAACGLRTADVVLLDRTRDLIEGRRSNLECPRARWKAPWTLPGLQWKAPWLTGTRNRIIQWNTCHYDMFSLLKKGKRGRVHATAQYSIQNSKMSSKLVKISRLDMAGFRARAARDRAVLVLLSTHRRGWSSKRAKCRCSTGSISLNPFQLSLPVIMVRKQLVSECNDWF